MSPPNRSDDVRHCRWTIGVFAGALLLAACETGDDGGQAQEAADDAGTDDATTDDAGADDAGTDDAGTDDAATGGQLAEHEHHFNLIAMAHSSPETVRGLTIEIETTPWDGESEGGPYSFASAPCDQDAPINNVSSNLGSLNTRLEGSRSPASTRLHPLEFEITSLDDDGSGELEGTIDLTICQPRFGVTPEGEMPDTDRERIQVEFDASFTQPTGEEATWWGDFELVDGTGPYEGITGSGRIAGYFMCLGPDPCEQRGEYRDAQVTMIGTYDDPEGTETE
jgi:hypothetical protein